jgi:aspartate kinase
MAHSSDSGSDRPLVVLKFGGTSVGTPEHMQTAADVIEQTDAEARVVAVVSALSNVTRELSDALERFAAVPEEQGEILVDLRANLEARHRDHATAVLSPPLLDRYLSVLDTRLDQLRRTFRSVQHQGFTPAARDSVLALGEQLSAPLLSLLVHDRGLTVDAQEATDLVVTDATFGAANVQHAATRQRVEAWHARMASDAVSVVAGFIGRSADGRVTTLGFEGSDYSAALFAQLLGARCLTRYTDVDALYTDDPATHRDAERLDTLSMDTAFALTESGRLGMHPKTLRPLVEAGIPMQVRPIATPSAPGTQILPENVSAAALIPGVAGATA